MRKNGKPQRFSSPAVETVRPEGKAMSHEGCAMSKSHRLRRWARPTGARSVPLTRLLLKKSLKSRKIPAKPAYIRVEQRRPEGMSHEA